MPSILGCPKPTTQRAGVSEPQSLDLAFEVGALWEHASAYDHHDARMVVTPASRGAARRVLGCAMPRSTSGQDLSHAKSKVSCGIRTPPTQLSPRAYDFISVRSGVRFPRLQENRVYPAICKEADDQPIGLRDSACVPYSCDTVETRWRWTGQSAKPFAYDRPMDAQPIPHARILRSGSRRRFLPPRCVRFGRWAERPHWRKGIRQVHDARHSAIRSRMRRGIGAAMRLRV